MRHTHVLIAGRDARLLHKIKPWEAGRPQTEGPNPSVPDKPAAVHTQVNQATSGHHHATHSASPKTTPPPARKPDRYQSNTLLIVTIMCALAAISTLSYILSSRDVPNQTMNVTSTSSTISSSQIRTSSSIAGQRAAPVIRKAGISSSAPPATSPGSTSSALPKSASASAASQAIQQLPATRAEERKLLKAIQDARRARQGTAGMEE